MSKRNDSREIETPFGTFHGGFWMVKDGDKAPSFYAETESGEVTVNGVTYRGTVYAERYGQGEGKLYLSVRHLTRWDDKRGHHYPASDSARDKLAAALLPTFEEWSADTEGLRAAQVKVTLSSYGYAVGDVNREIDKLNAIAAELRALGSDAPDVAHLAHFTDSLTA